MGMFDTIRFNLPEGSKPLNGDDAILQTKSLRKNLDEYDFCNGTMLLKQFSNYDTFWLDIPVNMVIPFTGAIIGYTIDSCQEDLMRYFRFDIKKGLIQTTQELSQEEVDLFEKNFEAPRLHEAFAKAIKIEQKWRSTAHEILKKNGF